MAVKNAIVRSRIEKRVKDQAERILRKLGISQSDAVSMLYHQVILQKGVPFGLKIPNKTTLAALEEDLSNSKEYKDLDEYWKSLDLKG